MDNNLYSVRPESLTPEELVRYAWLFNSNKEGLPYAWCVELITCLESYVLRFGTLPAPEVSSKQALL